MNQIRAEVANRIKSARIGRGISLSELARLSGVAKANLSKIETGNANPTLETLSALANALRVRLSDLVSMDDATMVMVPSPEGEWIEVGPARYRSITWSQLPGVQLQFIHGTIRRDVYQSVGRVPGMVHHIFILKGRWRIGPPGQEVEMGPGDFLRMKAQLPYSLEGLEDDCEAFFVAAYPTPEALGAPATPRQPTAEQSRSSPSTMSGI